VHPKKADWILVTPEETETLCKLVQYAKEEFLISVTPSGIITLVMSAFL
jgi:hypothetical protein